MRVFGDSSKVIRGSAENAGSETEWHRKWGISFT